MIRKNIRPTAVKKSTNIARWKHALKGEPAFLIGNGCSCNDQDLSPIKDYFTIGINRAFFLLDPVVLFWQDAHLWETEHKNVLKSRSLKVCRDIADPNQRFLHFRLRAAEGFRLPDGPNVLFGGGATGPLAFQLAYALGCNPIVLIGYDCKYRNAKTDFYGVNTAHKPHTLPNCLRGLRWIHGLNTERQVVNCSDNEILGPRSKLSDVVGMLPPPKGFQHYYELLNRLSVQQ